MAHITIGTTATRADYTASAGQTAFSVPFEFFDEDDLLVYKNNVLLTKTTHYTVTPVTTSDGGFDGGTVTLTSGNEASINDKVAIVLSMPYERSSDFPTAGPFNVTTLNTTLDKNAVRFKQIDERVSRALTGPTSEAGFAELPAKADRASRIMSFDTDGNPSTVATDSLSLATLQAFTDYKVTTGTGNGSNTTLTLSGDPGQEGNTQVYIDGVYQSKSNYSISGTTLTFSTAPPNGSAIEVVHGQAASTYAPPDNSIPYEKLLTSDIDTDLSSVSGSDDTLASAKAIKTYVDAQVTAQDLDFQADSGGALNIDLDSESLTLAGGTGIDTVGSGNTVTASVDSTVYRTGGTDVSVADGGTGVSSHTAGAILLGNGSNNLANTGVLSDGQMLVGDGSGNPALESGATLRTSIGVGTGDSPQFTGLTLTGNADIDGLTNLDAVDIDGAVQIDSTVTVGVDDTGYDVKFFGDTASAYMLWDASQDDLILGGAARLGIGVTNPLFTQTIAGADSATNLMMQSSGGLYRLGFYTAASQQRISSYNTTPLLFAINESEKMRIDAGGRALINKSTTQTANAPLQIASALGTGQVFVGNTSGTGYMFGRDNVTTGNFVLGEVSNDADTSVTNLLTISTGTGNATFAGDVTVGDDLHLDSDGAVLKFGDDADVTITHVADTGLKLEDNDKIIWGAGSDGNIYSDGTNFTFASASEHHYSNAFQFSNGGASATLMTATNGGSVDLYHNGVKVFETIANGVNIPAATTSQVLSVEASGGGAKIEMKATGGTLSTIGSTNSVDLALQTSGSEKMRVQTSGTVRPSADNTQDLGSSSYRWGEIFCGNGTINTSDQREKTEIAALDEAERRVAIALKGLVKKYRFKDAVAAKGDNARIHVGVIAQEVVEAFSAEGLDATQYALLCYDEWEAVEEVLSDDGDVVTPALEAGDRYGIRYDELLAFIIAAL